MPHALAQEEEEEAFAEAFCLMESFGGEYVRLWRTNQMNKPKQFAPLSQLCVAVVGSGGNREGDKITGRLKAVSP